VTGIARPLQPPGAPVDDGAPYPTDTEVAVLHERVLIGHPDAVEALIERLLPVLVALVKRAFPKTPDDLALTAVEDALLEYSRRPTRFDRSRGVPLLLFLRLAAVRNLSNLRRAEARRQARLDRYAHEVLSDLRNSRFAEERDRERTSEALWSALSELSADEQAAMALWLGGERRSRFLAGALRIDHLPIKDQEGAVKRLKDRVRNRVKRVSNAMKRRR
jgi:hypothetical protein